MNKKRLFSLLIAIAIVCTSVGSVFAQSIISIDDMPKQTKSKIFVVENSSTTDFRGTRPDGFGVVSGPTKSAVPSVSGDGSFPSKCYAAKIATESNPDNYAIYFQPHMTYHHVTQADLDKMTTNVTIKGTQNTINAYESSVVIDTSNNTAPCYIASTTGDINGQLIWYYKDATTGEAYAPAKIGSMVPNLWFYQGTPYLTASSGTSATMPSLGTTGGGSPTEFTTDNDGNFVGTYSISLNLLNTRVGTWNALEGEAVGLTSTSVNHVVYLSQGAVYTDGGVANPVGYNSQGTAVTVSGKNNSSGVTLVGKNADTVGIFSKDDISQLEQLPARQGNVWYNIMYVLSFDENVYRIYLDGKPMFFAVYVSGNLVEYTSELYLPKTKTEPRIIVYAQRGNYFNDNGVYVDDYTMSYDAAAKTIGSVETQLKPSLANSDGIDAYMGAMISTTLPEGTLTKMKWVFNTPTERLYSTQTLTPNVAVSGSVKFAAVLKNGIVADGAITGTKDIIGVDAIFEVDGANFYTNAIDKANFGRIID